MISSSNKQLLHMSDAVLHPMNVEHPTWRNVFDLNEDIAATTRQRLLDRAVADEVGTSLRIRIVLRNMTSKQKLRISVHHAQWFLKIMAGHVGELFQFAIDAFTTRSSVMPLAVIAP